MGVCGGGRAAVVTAAHQLTRQHTVANTAGQRPSNYSSNDMLALSKASRVAADNSCQQGDE